MFSAVVGVFTNDEFTRMFKVGENTNIGEMNQL